MEIVIDIHLIKEAAVRDNLLRTLSSLGIEYTIRETDQPINDLLANEDDPAEYEDDQFCTREDLEIK